MSEELLVSIEVSRIKDKIDYTVDCSKDVTSEELVITYTKLLMVSAHGNQKYARSQTLRAK